MATITKTVKSVGGDYATLGAAEAGIRAGADNVAGNTIVIECYAFEDSSGAWFAAGWNVDAIYINVAAGNQHNGTRGTGYRLIRSVDGNPVLWISTSKPVYINGVACKNSDATESSGSAFQLDGTVVAVNFLIYDTAESYGIYLANPTSVKLINGAFYGGKRAIFQDKAGFTSYVYACTTLNCATRQFRCGSGTMTCKNCYAGGTDGYTGAGSFSNSGCCSSDATGSTTVSIANCQFTNNGAGAENAHIGAASSLIGIGVDLRADAQYNVTTDFEGENRAAVPCVGWDEYVAAAGAMEMGMLYQHFNQMRH